MKLSCIFTEQIDVFTVYCGGGEPQKAGIHRDEVVTQCWVNAGST